MSEIQLTGFELLTKVGQGGMGQVWKARQLSLDRIVAVKLLPPGLDRNSDAVKRMMTEARTAARLKHPGIVQVYDASEQGGTFFFVMEFVDGYNVGQWVRRKKTIPWKDALLAAEHVAQALDYAWQSSGMIHCDIKPENIMVDKDGTIKVSDLGLSVTYETRPDASADILGTPSYMSPEQVRGDPVLDCRTDIYSLGATLYHMITGNRLFHDVSDRDAMDRQLTHQVPDPRELVPDLPTPVAALLERLLVKDKAGRPRNWAAAITDLRRVQRGLMPAGKPPPAGASTIKRARIQFRRGTDNQEAQPPEKRGCASWVAWAVVIAALVAAAILVPPRVARWRTAQQAGAPGSSAFPGTPLEDDGALGRDQAIANLENADRWMRANPERFDEGMGRYRMVIAQFPDSPEAALALQRVKHMRERREQAIAAVWTQLKAQAQALAGKGQYRDAAHLLDSYTGLWAMPTASNRADLARQWRQKDGLQELARLDEENWQAWVKGLGAPLALGKFAAVQQTVAQAESEGRFKAHAANLASLAQILKGIAAIDERVLQSFARQTGTVVRVGLGRGEIAVLVAGVNGKKVRGRTLDGQAEVLIGYDELSLQEQMARLGPPDVPEVAIVKGVVAAKAGSYDPAAKFFAGAGPLLSGPLLDKLAEWRNGVTDDGAMPALARVMKLAGMGVGGYEEAVWLAAVNRCAPDRERAALAAAELDKFLEKFGTTPFATRAAPVVLALQQWCGRAAEAGGAAPEAVAEAPAVPAVPAVPAGIDTAALRQALAGRNAGLEPDAIQFAPFEGVQDAQVQITSDWVRDVSPVAAVKEIKSLHLKTVRGGTMLLDVKALEGSGITELRLERYLIRDAVPLRSCRLTRLAVPGSPLASIAALEGMGLSELNINGSEIRDLNAIRGMSLEWLDVGNTKIASLVLLAGQPLKGLNAAGTAVRDVYALKGLPLESLNLARTAVSDFQPLKGLRLTTLDLSGTKVHELSFCLGMPLKTLILRDTPVQDVSALKGRTLDLLDLGGSQVRDLRGLAGCDIRELRLDGTRVSTRDLMDLKQVSVERLNVSGTGVTSLGFLEGKALTSIQVADTKIKSLAPLAGMPLRELDCQGTEVVDYAPLRNMPIESLRINGDMRDLRGIAGSLMNLKTLNGFDVRDRGGQPPPNGRNALLAPAAP